MPSNETIEEIIVKAIPLNMDCALEKQKAVKRRVDLKQRILSLLDEQLRNIQGMAGNASGENKVLH